MSTTTAKSIVLIAYVVMLALIALNTSGKYSSTSSSGGTPSKYKALWAASLLTLMLAVVADVAPQIAGPLAVLAVLAVAVKNPGELGPLAAGKTPAASTTGG